ncbi:rhodanese-like domain-containing protein [Carboxylicivirga mesophila]|uniref:Rhodanese-like domain-containing protein n=1 Tax=Carboxylicivirga mesophila TaxID=1166478 RepID=A0ABS5K4H5_9BACT|nr:rhodanese-like domain-containing protein [Carboxylicivirga mesophila]MBS2209882.1 rhodanese-like domain-containing protein [Carboxylicivirga mesophila]
MKRLFVYISCLAALMSCQTQTGNLSVDDMVASASKVVTYTTPADLMKTMESEEIFSVIDVRQSNEHYHGFIPGAVNIPRGSMEFNIGTEAFWETEGLYVPQKDEMLILYCKKGKRSTLAAQTLMQMGYNKVYVLEGGWKNWELTYPDFCDKNLEMLAGGPAKHDDGGGC